MTRRDRNRRGGPHRGDGRDANPGVGGGLDLGDEVIRHVQDALGGQRRRLLDHVHRPGVHARMTCSPLSLAALSRTTGTGRRAICRRRKSSPSISGMFRSRVTTSGRSCSTNSSASAPSRAAPTTSRKGLRQSICRTTLRTYAESSTISTRTTPAIDSALARACTHPKRHQHLSGFPSSCSGALRRPICYVYERTIHLLSSNAAFNRSSDSETPTNR